MKLRTVSPLFFALSLPLAATSCVETSPEIDSLSSSQKEILGGLGADVGEFPTTVAILNGGLCTGTLIAPDLVLTAAHCLKPQLLKAKTQDEVTRKTKVILDTQSAFAGGGIRIQALETIPHPEFSVNSLGNNDIGLIRLKRAVTDREPTPINRTRSAAPIGIELMQVGYGQSISGSQQSAGQLNVLLRKKTVSCAPYEVSNENMICFSQSDGKGKCSGDSGGPSYATIDGVERVVGVTSFGDRMCQVFGADTRVDAELDFLFEYAPELQCQADGECNKACDKNGLPADKDCQTCTTVSDCGDLQICSNEGYCVAEPFSPGGDGSQCAGDTQCDSSICANSGDSKICASHCDSNNQCSEGFDCLEADNGANSVCWPAADTGWCSASGHGRVPLSGIFLLGVALFFVRKPRNLNNVVKRS